MSRRHTIFVLLVAALTTGQWQCSNPTVAGAGSETTNGAAIAGTMVDPGWVALSGVEVDMRPVTYLAGDTGKTTFRTTTDSAGAFDLGVVPPGVWVFHARAGDSLGIVRTLTVHGTEASVSFERTRLLPLGSIAGLVANAAALGPLSVGVYGLDRKIAAQGDGSFLIEGMPPGRVMLRLSTQSAGYVPLEVAAGMGDTLSGMSIGTVKEIELENFDDGDDVHLLAGILPGAGWFAGLSGTATLDPPSIDNDVSTALVDSGSYSGKSLHVRCILGTDLLSDAVVGVDIGKGRTGHGPAGVWYDLSDMDAFAFRARGSGRVTVLFIARLINDTYTGESNFEAVVDLDSSWSEYRIPAASIAPPAGSAAHTDGRRWDEAATAVAEMSFAFRGDCDLWLDDIRIEGMAPIDLVKQP